MSNVEGLNLHEDPVMFRESVNYTASVTGYNSRLIEKDYFCSLVLACIYSLVKTQLVFKGGTCLAKVYAGFYRLSEDLDFVIPISVDSTRSIRKDAAADVKTAFREVSKFCPVFSISKDIHGANNSSQYYGSVGYKSFLTNETEDIIFEVSLREQLQNPVKQAHACTILLDPISGEKMVAGVGVDCIDFTEAFAEKFRAALTRREVAIRDFYDIDYAVRHLGLDVYDNQFIDLVREKLLLPGNLPVDISNDRLNALHRQMNTRLKSVLMDSAFKEFDIEHAVRTVVQVAKCLS